MPQGSGVARVAELGEAWGKGLRQGGKHICNAQRADAISAGGLWAEKSRFVIHISNTF